MQATPPETALRRAASYLTFPALMFGPLALALAAIDSGLPPEYVNPALVPPVILAIALLERWLPEFSSWNRSRGDVGTDVCYYLLSPVVVLTATGTLTVVLSSALPAPNAWWAWPRQWPLLGQLLLALIISEFGHYWWHRLAHEVPALWRVHGVHHSAERLYWCNTARFHPLDLLASTLLGFGPLMALGTPPEALALFTLCGTINNTFQHANIKVRLGPLNYVFSMAEAHRWHHSRNPREGNTNYGGHLILWDIVFRTRFLPRQAPPENVGTDAPQFPKGFFPQLAFPFASLLTRRLENSHPAGALREEVAKEAVEQRLG